MIEAENGILFELPVRGSNDDHLDLFAREGARFGEFQAEKIAGALHRAAQFGISTMSEYVQALTAARVPAVGIVAQMRKLRVPSSASVDKFFVEAFRNDLKENCDELRRRGYRRNRIARFRVSGWRAAKLILRASVKMRVH